MTDSDFDQLEQFFGRPLPVRYREVMSQYPLDPADHNSAIALYRDCREVIGWNDELLGGEWSELWSADRFAIGMSACGDTYFLDLTNTSPAVFMWDHETHEVTTEAADLDSFIAEQQRQEAEAKALDATQPAKRPWWRFWG